MYDHAERMARAAIRKMPAGTWSAEDQLDDNGVNRGIPVKVIAPEGTIFNASSTAPTNLYGWPTMNAVEAVTKALAATFPEKLPAGSGGDLC